MNNLSNLGSKTLTTLIKLLPALFLLCFYGSLNAQIFTQDFSSSSSLSDYISAEPGVGQFGGIRNTPDVTATITNGALRFNKTAIESSYFFRTPVPVLSPEPLLIQLKFDFEVTNNDPNHPDPEDRRAIPFAFGPEFSEGFINTLTMVHSRFGLGISATEGNFFLKILDNGITQSADFSGKQTITFIANNSGNTQTYTAPDGTSESIGDDKWEIWVGNTRVFNDVTSRNPNLKLGSFKLQYNSFLPLAILDFDNFEYTSLLNAPPQEPGPQSLVHPHIWVTNSDKQGILDNINQYSWARSMFDQLVNRQALAKSIHTTNPGEILNQIPPIPGDRTAHRELLNTGVESAILYYLTEDEDYAQLSSDILFHYVNMIKLQDPLDFEFYSSSVFNHLIPPREHFPRVAMIYDFVQPFLSQPSTAVYDLDSGERVSFDFEASQKAFEVMADNVIRVGANNSNHPVLELPGALYSVLCMEDDDIRAVYFDQLMNGPGNSRQPGVNWMLNRFSNEDRLWPESAGYAKFTHGLFIQIMNVVDKYKPELNLISNNKDLLESIFIYENFLYPNGATMAFGDINRNFTDHAHFFISILEIAKRKGYTDLEERATSTLKKIYTEEGGYNPVIETQSLEWNNPLQLLWGKHLNESISASGEPMHSSLHVKHAGVAMQRNYVETDNEQYGLMSYTGGGTYVHAHATGLDMEIYGAGYVIGPDYGNDTYGTVIHKEYAVSHAAHNTIIVNGESKRGISNSGTWNNIVDPIVLVGIEPKVNSNPISENFSFTTQFLDDNINYVDQQRTNSIIRTSPTSGYYVDIFRSFSLIDNNFHDYLFHGLGDVMQIKSEDDLLSLTDTPTRYENDIGDFRRQPGWHWYEEAKTSAPTVDPITIRFDLQFDHKYLHVNVPGGIDREYSSALAPPSKEVSNGYDNVDTKMFIMRKYGEAWNEPFIAIYEPSANAESAVKSTENIYVNNKVVGVIVISVVNDQEITDYVLSNDGDNVSVNLTEHQIAFTGRFAIVRTEVKETKTDVSLYIGKGQQLTYIDRTLTADADNKAYLEYEIENTLSSENFQNSEKYIITFPNPTKGLFDLRVPVGLKEIKLDIYNIQSQLIKSKTYTVNNGRVSLDLIDNTKGIYFIKVHLDKPVHIKVIKN